jgi:hypothetical protein
MLDRIKLRHLLTAAQGELAIAAGLALNRRGASLTWREALGPSKDPSTRLARARELLDSPKIQLDEPTRLLMTSDEGMHLVVEYHSQVRDRGDRVAHPPIVSRGNYDEAVSRHPFSTEIPGLKVLTEFVCARINHD